MGVTNASRPMASPVLPQINLNGTSRKDLMDGYHRAYEATEKALEVMAVCGFHGRDYQTLEAHQWAAARQQREAEMAKLHEVLAYLEAHLMHLV